MTKGHQQMIDWINTKRKFSMLVLVVGALLITGCDVVPLHMRQQARFDPLEKSTLFENGMASRPLPANTVPRGEWGKMMMDDVFFTGKVDGDAFVQTAPIAVDADVIRRGQDRYNVFCSPCHGYVGNGDGIVVQRGFQKPPSFHDQRLRDVEDGYYYDVMTNGFGAMYSYASRIRPADRWAIVAYIRTLQYSQNVVVENLPADNAEAVQSQLK